MSPIPLEQLAPVRHLALDLFLLGFAAGLSLTAALFFLRFWRDTRDFLFLGFAAFFLILGGTNVVVLDLAHPNEGSAWIFLLRLLSTLIVVAVILIKNAGRG